VLPRELLNRLRVGRGDSLYVVETPTGIELTPCRPDFAAQMDPAEDLMREPFTRSNTAATLELRRLDRQPARTATSHPASPRRSRAGNPPESA
jgi:hypothetical protein